MASALATNRPATLAEIIVRRRREIVRKRKGLIQAAEKALDGEVALGAFAGLKPNADLIEFIGPTKVVPLLQSLWSGHEGEFSACCYRPDHRR
jgi:hypothetical protein